MGKQSKIELEKAFWEKWKVKIFQMFKKSDARKKLEEEQDKKEMESYINFIYDYTEIHGVRETARRIEVSHATLSQIRNGHTEGYAYETVKKFAEAIGNLSAEIGNDEKKVE